MDQTEQDQSAPEAIPAASNGSGTSFMDEVRALRERRAEETQPRFVVDIPAYEDEHGNHRLAVIFEYPMSGAERLMQALELELEGEGDNDRLEAACMTLVEACAAVVGRDTKGNLIDPVTGVLVGPDEKPGLPESPMRFDRKLADAFKIDVPNEVKTPGRFICRSLYSPKGQSNGLYDGDLALITTSRAVFAWLHGRRVKADEETAGE